jgi:transcriptional regulator with XRE-family HTH domain
MPMARTMTPEQLRARRTTLGLSQASLGGSVGVTQATISNWESGRSSPSGEQVAALRDVLGTVPPGGQSAGAAPSDGGYGDWLSAARVEQGLSRAELAARSGVSAPQIWNIETGATGNPRASTRAKLEGALGVSPPRALVEAVQHEAEIGGVGQFVDFDPHDESDFPSEPGVYVFYDISDRPVYVGQSGDIRKRIRGNHLEKFWYRPPIVEKASYVRVDDQTLRRQLENTLIKFMKSNAVINQKQVDR